MENREKLSALAWAAHERGLTYGDLMAQTSALAREKIYKEYAKILKERRALEKRRAEEYAAAEEKERRRK